MNMIDHMADTQAPTGTQLHLEKALVSTPERVFAASVDAEQLRGWWGPTPFTVPRLRFDAVEGTAARLKLHRVGWTETLERLERSLG